MSWRVAMSLLVLRGEIDRLRPERSRVADGTIGDAAHRSRKSDHNPWVPPPAGGVVTAMDITDDRNTLTDAVSEALRASRDSRIKYVIGERRMFSSYPTTRYPAWTWRPYSGPNAHTSHMHVSVQPHNYDDDRPWGIAPSGREGETVLERGDKGPAVRLVQTCLEAEADVAGRSAPLPKWGVDGDYGAETESAVSRYQKAAKVPVTGRVDGLTAALLLRYEPA